MYYAELDTDKFIRETFFPDISYLGTMIEVGAGPAKLYSMSKHFRDTGWRCICIEPNPRFVEQHKVLNHEIYNYACADFIGNSKFTIVEAGVSDQIGMSHSALEKPRYAGAAGFKHDIIDVKVTTLNSLLESLSITTVDFVSVDTEGWELDVMRGFDVVKYKPAVVLLENYLYEDSYVEYMSSVGYDLYENIEYNYIFSLK